MSRHAFEAICAEAHIRKSVRLVMEAALLGAQEPGGGVDDVAGALLRWADARVRRAVERREAHERRLSAYTLQRVNQRACDWSDVHANAPRDVSGQMMIADVLDGPPEAGGAVH